MKKVTVNELCQFIADNVPVEMSWPEDKKPWGCIHTKENKWYCDNCIVEKYCTLEKHWSK